MLQITPDIKKLLENSIIAFGTCDKHLRPNVIAVACVKVVGPNQVLITDNFFNKTYKNILENSLVSLAFWDPTDSPDGNRGYQLKGSAQYMTSGDWKKRVDRDPNNANLAHKGAVLVNITEIWDLADPHLISQENN